MSIRNVTLSGVLIDAEKKQSADISVQIHSITDLFKTSLLVETKTEQDGKYHVEFPMHGLEMPILITSGSPFLKKFILVNEASPEVDIPSPSAHQKKRKLEPQRVTAKTKSSSFDALAKRTYGDFWQEKVLKDLPNITTESIQQEYRPQSISLSADEEISFLKNSLFFDPPEINEKLRTCIYQIPFFDPHHPEVKITLRERLAPSLLSVALKYGDEEWQEAGPDDPRFNRFLYLANSAALAEGISSKLLTWTHVMPARYAQAFLSTISEKNPLKKLLGSFLNDAFLIDRHLGIQNDSPLLDLILSMGAEGSFVDQQLLKGLKLNLKEMIESEPQEHKLEKEGSHHRRHLDLRHQIDLYRKNVLHPVLDEFFDWYRNELTYIYFLENQKLLSTFSFLESRLKDPAAVMEQPQGDLEEKDKKIVIKQLKNWCEEALLLTTLYPFIVTRSLEYLTDIRFGSLRPENRALNNEDEFDLYGKTSPETAAKQLSRIQLILHKKRSHVMHMTGHYSRLNHYLEKAQDDLARVGINIEKLTI